MSVFTAGLLYLGKYGLHVYAQGIEPPVEDVDVKRYATLDPSHAGFRRAAAGLGQGRASWDMLVDFDATSESTYKSHDIVRAAWKTSDVPVSVVVGSGAEGDPAWFFRALTAGYKPNGPVGDLLAAKVDVVSSQGPVVYGSALQIGTKTSGGNGTGLNLGAIATGKSLHAALHVTACAGGTLTVTVQSDDNAGFTSATARASFAGVTAAGFEWIETAGPITDTYWRALWTLTGGSATFAVCMGIR